MPKCRKHNITFATYGDCSECIKERPASAQAPGSPCFVARLGRLLQLPEREWTEKDVIEATRDLVARHKYMCAQLQDAVQKYRLGLGGEPVDRLVLDELHRLKQNNQTVRPEGAPQNHE